MKRVRSVLIALACLRLAIAAEQRELTPRVDEAVARDYFERKQRDPKLDWKSPIVFYGKVVDQHGNPVEGATVKIAWTDLSPQGSSKREMITDAQGRFSISGIRGKRMNVFPEKAGYSRSHDSEVSFEFADPTSHLFHRPNAKKPVVFKMFKHGPKSGGLVHGKLRLPIDHSKATNVFVVFGRDVENIGPVTIYAVSGPEQENTRRYDWVARLKIEGAVIVETKEEFTVMAPQNGYTNELTWRMDKNDPDWRRDFEKTVYFKTMADERYGKLQIGFVPKGTLIRLSYTFNRQGGRGLE